MRSPDSPPPRFSGFQALMRRRIQDILLVSSLYDSFILSQDRPLDELLLGEFLGLNLRYVPGLTQVSTGTEALDLARRHTRYNLIISSMQVGDMNVLELARRVKAAGLDAPVALLSYDARELTNFLRRYDTRDLERAFLWQGDVRILLAIVKCVEDRMNVAHDTGVMGVQAIILIEDNVRFYSSLLPVIYTELMEHARRLLPDGLNVSHKLMRAEARPKVLLCTTFEEASEYFTTYEENVLGVIADVEFPKAGRLSAHAGVDFAAMVRARQPDVPVLLQSSQPANEAAARRVGAAFLLKRSPHFLHQLRQFIVEHFGFSDFVFRLPDGSEAARARDLRSLEELLHSVSAESIAYHAERNHFSKWLKARTEFALAHQLRPRKVSDFATVEDLRAELIRSIGQYRHERGRAIVADFDRQTFEPDGFWRLGGGALGGKARGLAFVNLLLNEHAIRDRFPGVRIAVPPSLVVGTDVFDDFLQRSDLTDYALECEDESLLQRAFSLAALPEQIVDQLSAFLDLARWPLAVRSSSLLEDSQYHPFAGIYATYMLPNNAPDQTTRLRQLIDAIKRVYASTFARHARGYLAATGYRLEEEKMAVVVQRLVGSPHGPRFYPHFAGVARSHNFYPAPPMTSEDGIAAVALGLGATVVDGETCLRFCPRYPRHLVQFSSVKDMLDNSQRHFHALNLAPERSDDGPGFGSELGRHSLDVAEQDGTLAPVASTYSLENDAIYDSLGRRGPRLVSFAPVLKHRLFPLAEIIDQLLDVGRHGTSSSVEIEFAVNLDGPADTPKEFAFLQLRPLALSRELAELEISRTDPARVICHSRSVLGHGRVDDVRDVVVADIHRFDRRRSHEAAREVARMNAELARHRRPYVLIGVGRWGSQEPLLGIPVTWDQIAGARIIVEAGFRDFRVTPSQGSHFFQNLAAANVGYFTVNPQAGEGLVDWEWLAAQPAVSTGRYARHLRFESPFSILMNGARNEGVILKP